MGEIFRKILSLLDNFGLGFLCTHGSQFTIDFNSFGKFKSFLTFGIFPLFCTCLERRFFPLKSEIYNVTLLLFLLLSNCADETQFENNKINLSYAEYKSYRTVISNEGLSGVKALSFFLCALVLIKSMKTLRLRCLLVPLSIHSFMDYRVGAHTVCRRIIKIKSSFLCAFLVLLSGGIHVLVD